MDTGKFVMGSNEALSNPIHEPETIDVDKEEAPPVVDVGGIIFHYCQTLEWVAI